MAKRGRKRKHYFGPEQEDAVKRYLESEDPEIKNKIYDDWLKGVFIKMAESLMRKNDWIPENYTHDEILTDTLSHLVMKMDRFDPKTNNKAYSYFTVVCSNHLLGFKIKEDKSRVRSLPFEEVYPSHEENHDMIYSLPDTDYGSEDLILDIVEEIKVELESEGKTKKKMNDNERKVGKALVEILGNWEQIFSDMKGGPKYNKNNILHTIRDYTFMSTKDIRISLIRYKKIYSLLKLSKIRDGYM